MITGYLFRALSVSVLPAHVVLALLGVANNHYEKVYYHAANYEEVKFPR